jgi:hypothetical protein
MCMDLNIYKKKLSFIATTCTFNRVSTNQRTILQRTEAIDTPGGKRNLKIMPH